MVACVTSGSTSAGASPGLGDGQSVSSSSRPSHSRVTAARSAVVPSRRSPGHVVEHVRGHAVARRDEAVAAEHAVPGGVAAGEEDRPAGRS